MSFDSRLCVNSGNCVKIVCSQWHLIQGYVFTLVFDGVFTIAEMCLFVDSDDKLLYINSPDSNDSGIQADVAHIRAPQTEDLYAVVKKPSKTKADDTAVRPEDAVTSEVSRSTPYEGR